MIYIPYIAWFMVAAYCDVLLFFEPIASGVTLLIGLIAAFVGLFYKKKRKVIFNNFGYCVAVFAITLLVGYYANNTVDANANELIAKIEKFKDVNNKYPDQINELGSVDFVSDNGRIGLGAKYFYGELSGKYKLMYQYFPLGWKEYNFETKTLVLNTD